MSIFDPPKSFMECFTRPWATMPYVIVLMGALFFIIGAKAWVETWIFFAGSTEAMVTVVDVESKAADRGGTFYRSVFQTKIDGELRTHVGNHWSDPPLHSKGDVVNGRYDPESGEIVSLRTLDKQTDFGTVFAVTGLILGLCAGVFFLVKWQFT